MSFSSQIKYRMLYKLFGISWLPYARLSSQTAAIMEGHVQIGQDSKEYLQMTPLAMLFGGIFNSIQQTLETCLVYKSRGGPNLWFKHNIPSLELTFHVISINIIGPLPIAISGH